MNDLVKGTNFPWLMSNVIDKETNRPLAEGNISKVIEWEGCRIELVSNEKLVQIRDNTATQVLFMFEHICNQVFVSSGRIG